MNARDKSALLLCGGTLMWAPEVGEDVGFWSPQNFVPESVPVCIILPDIDGLRIKVVGFLVPWKMWVMSYSHVHWNNGGKRKWRVLLFSWHDWTGNGIKHDIKSRYDLIKSLNRKSCRASWCHLPRNIFLALQNNCVMIQLFSPTSKLPGMRNRPSVLLRCKSGQALSGMWQRSGSNFRMTKPEHLRHSLPKHWK